MAKKEKKVIPTIVSTWFCDTHVHTFLIIPDQFNRSIRWPVCIECVKDSFVLGLADAETRLERIQRIQAASRVPA